MVLYCKVGEDCLFSIELSKAYEFDYAVSPKRGFDEA